MLRGNGLMGHGEKVHNVDAPAMEKIRESGRFARTIAMAAVLFLLNGVIWPSWAVALEVERQKDIAEQARWEAKNQHLDQVLKHVRDRVRDRKAVIDQRLAKEGGMLDNMLSAIGLSQLTLEGVDDLSWLSGRAEHLHQQALKEFDTTAKRLREKQLPEKIQQRHAEARQQYRERYQTMQVRMAAMLEAESLQEQQDAAASLKEWMDSFTLEKPRDPFDPNNLPWGTPDPSLTPEPAFTARELSARNALPLFERGVQLASNVITPDMLGQPGGPTEEDLAATLDAQLTDAIRAKAEALDHDPVKIYQWVRNNIEFIPSHGSIQGADYTLLHGKGNAYDTASLLVALLRAANIPARYTFGTVQMPADQVMNWVGNVNTPQAASDLLGQGGIPNVGMVSGGEITHINLEHVWVEAWIDYHPSRGAKHSVGDSWVPMDASFKQYEYTEGLALEEQVPFDAQGLAQTIEQESTINEEEGWVQGVPQQAMEDAFSDYRTQLEAFLENQAPDATVGEVLGTQNIKTVIHQQLAAGLPYQLLTRKLVASELSDSLRWKFRYQLYTNQFGRQGSELISIQQPTVALAGRKLALSFKPATPEDEETLASYLPEPDENGEVDPNDIPDTLPGYLIDLTGEFTIGNEVVATATSNTTMGSELQSEMGYWQPNQGWRTSQNEAVAGEYRALALNLQGISQSQAQDLQTDLESTRQKLEAEDFAGLTKQQVVGDLLYSTILSYFALNDMQDKIGEKQAHSVGYRAPSYGLFKTSLSPVYFYGIPRNVKATGLTMDVDRFAGTRVDKDGNVERRLAFNRARGARLSAMEHLVPEQMYSTDDAPAHGISAVKAIQLAAAEGQKIWTITQGNLDQALAGIELSDEVETDIRNSVYAGKEVTAHERPVNFFGSESSGYIVLDPYSGAGAYLIEGGENGGRLKAGPVARFMFSAGVADSLGAKLLKRFGILNMVLTLVDLVYSISDALDECDAHPIVQALLVVFMVTMFAFFTYLVITFTAGLAGAIIPLIIGEMMGIFQSQINELARKYACLG